MIRARLGRCTLGAAVVVAALAAAPTQAASDNVYTVTPLVSNQPGAAAHQDTDLVNAWGLTAAPVSPSRPNGSPWWVADNGTSVSTLYTANGTKVILNIGGMSLQHVNVGLDNPPDSAPTGIVFNGGSDFKVSLPGGPSLPAVFIFDAEDGGIYGWNPGVDPAAAVPAPNDDPPGEQIYKGLAIANNMLYATDFHNGLVDVFDGSWHLVNQFTDPFLPRGFAPFGIQTINGNVFVTFAKQDADAEDDVAGPGLGFVDEFSPSGILLRRVAFRGLLNAPWGLAWAPDNFGRFSGDLLIGNFGDGRITAYHQWPTGLFTPAGQLKTGPGDFVEIDGLWALQFGTGGTAGPTNSLFFTAGPNDESDGLFGSITAG
jgi:uncharacterized protein (TIGR03118 family)